MNIIFWFINITALLVFGVEIPPPDINSLTLKFTNEGLGQLNTKVYSGCTGYSPTKDEIFVLGGDQFIGNENVPYPDTLKRGQAYNPRTQTTRDITLDINTQRGEQGLFCTSQNYITSGERLIMVFKTEIYVFDMVKEETTTFNVNYLDADDSTVNGDVEAEYFAVTTDNDENLFVVSRDKLYVLDLYTFAKKLSGPKLVVTGRSAASAAYANGKLYVMGGVAVNGNNVNYQVGVEKTIIDIDTPTNMGFSNIGKVTTSNYLLGTRVLISSGYIYIIGGADAWDNGKQQWNSRTTVNLLNPANDAIKGAGNTVTGRLYHGVVQRYGKIFALAGLGAYSADLAGNALTSIDKSTTSITAECTNDYRDNANIRRLVPGGNFGGPGAAPDPHFRSLYQTAFDFHGDGCYYYVKTCPGAAYNLPFSIRAKHYKCNGVARCMEDIYVELFDTNSNSVKVISVLNEPSFDGVIEGVGDLLITAYNPRQRILRLQTPFAKENNCGYDFNLLITKTALGVSWKMNFPNCYKCESCGMAGYYGESKNYQFIMGDELGTLKGSRSFNDYGFSWKYGDTCFQPQTRPDKGPIDLEPSVCEEDLELKAQIQAECDKIQVEFADCCQDIPDECNQVLKDCVFDGCAIKTDEPNKPISEAVRDVGVDNLAVACQVKDGIPDPNDLKSDSPTQSPTKGTPEPTVTQKEETASPTKGTPTPTEGTPEPTVTQKEVTGSPTKGTPAPTEVTPAPTITNPNIYTCPNPLREPVRRLVPGGDFMGPAHSAGDPHFKTFHGSFYDYQGKGCYYYLRLCPGKPDGLIPFSIRAQHRKCNSVARCIENVYIDIINKNGDIVETIDTKTDLIKDVDQVVSFEGIGDLTIGKWQNDARIFELVTPFATENHCTNDFKLTVRTFKYNGGNFLNYYVDVPECYLCDICGLMGFVNPDKTKQFLSRNGNIETDINKFAESYHYSEECVCPETFEPPKPEVLPPPICEKDPALKNEVNEKCENIINADPTLKECCEKNPIDCQNQKDNCKKDVCAHLTDNINTPVDEAVDKFTDINLGDFCKDPPNPVTTKSPVKSPTKSPVIQPTNAPSIPPTKSPVIAPSKSPVPAPTRSPFKEVPGVTRDPTRNPTKTPTKKPTKNPTKSPTDKPTKFPTPKTPAPTSGIVIVPECRSIFGPEAIATSEQTVVTSEATCPEGFTLVSCGMFGSIHSPAGTLITNGDTCTAINIFGRKIDRIQAVARCCAFPPDSDIDIIKKNGGSESSSETKCVEPEVLIGCGASSTDNNVIGSFLGNNVLPQESNELVSTDNQCNAQGYDETCVTANAQCAVYNTIKYNLKCESQTLLTNTPLTCPNGYFMTSCSGLTKDEVVSLDNTTPLDNNYVSAGHECKAQQDNLRDLYTSMVCCQLTTTVDEQVPAKYKDINELSQHAFALKNSTIIAILMCIITILLTLIGLLLCYNNGKFDFKKGGYSSVANPNDSTYSTDSTDAD